MLATTSPDIEGRDWLYFREGTEFPYKGSVVAIRKTKYRVQNIEAAQYYYYELVK